MEKGAKQCNILYSVDLVSFLFKLCKKKRVYEVRAEILIDLCRNITTQEFILLPRIHMQGQF